MQLKFLEKIQDEAVTLDPIFNQARSLERALKNAEVYNTGSNLPDKSIAFDRVPALKPEVTAHSFDQDESERCVATKQLR